MKRGLDVGRQRIYDEFNSLASTAIPALLRRGDAAMVREAAQAVGALDPEPLLAMARGGEDLPIDFSIVPRGGLDAFTIKTGDRWSIGVHEHTPQLLAAFTGLAFAAQQLPLSLEHILEAGVRQGPTQLLDLAHVEPTDDRADLVVGLSRSALTFVIAHELGHLLLGHSAPGANADPELIARGLPHSFFTAREEIEADGVAARLLGAGHPDQATLDLAGARVFFELAHAFEAHLLGEASVSRLAWTHPHPALRLAAVQACMPPYALSDGHRFIQEDLDEALGRPPLTRPADAVESIKILAAQAPTAQLVALLSAPLDHAGRRLDGGALKRLISQSEALSSACVALAARDYVEANPFRWRGAEQGIALATVWRQFEVLGRETDGQSVEVEQLVRAVVPELDEILSLQSQTVHWVGGDA